MPTVLIVDDEPHVRALIADTLELDDYTVRQACDGREALAELTLSPPECLVLDVMMPGMSGLEVLAVIRADPRWMHLPVLLLTAAADDTTTWKGWAAGANCYLAKPFDPDELLRWLEVLLKPADVHTASAAAGDGQIEPLGPVAAQTAIPVPREHSEAVDVPALYRELRQIAG